MSSSKVFVTGAAGFIGSHLIEQLLPEHEVHACDVIPLEQADALRDVRSHPNLRYAVIDIRDRDSVRSAWPKDADVVYHLASVVGIKNYLADPLVLIDTIVGGTRNVLEAAREHATKVVFASTSEVYGKNPATPWSEDGDRVLGPTSVDRWSYSSAKAVCEHMLYGIRRQCGLPFGIVRFFNAYGPRQNPYFVVSQTIYRVLRGEQPLLYDDGRSTRCFTYVGDIVQGIVAVGREPRAIGECFNLGASLETSVKELIDTVLRLTGSQLTPKDFRTEREYGNVYEDIIRRVPAVNKAAQMLGWQARTNLEDGLRQTIDWAMANPWYLASGRS